MDISNALIELTKENVLRFIDFRDIYRHYLGEKLVYNRAFSSPFRQDKNPSFVVNQKTGYFRDFATGDSGDYFAFVMKLYNLNFYDALKQIVHDLHIAKHFVIMDRSVQPSKKLKVENISNRGTFQGDFNLKVKTRKFQAHDLEFWNSYGISLKYLQLGNIHAITHYFINGKQYVAERYAYVYVEMKDGIETYKVYQPKSNMMKWINGNNYSVWELWRLMPETYDELIITSSRKDALSIIENCKIPATSFQAESINPKAHVVEDILNRFKHVYLLYDNDYENPDNPGQMLAEKRIDQFGFTNLVIPEMYESKDFSDLVFNLGRAEASKILRHIINQNKDTYNEQDTNTNNEATTAA
jgi:hypothetical protein